MTKMRTIVTTLMAVSGLVTQSAYAAAGATESMAAAATLPALNATSNIAVSTPLLGTTSEATVALPAVDASGNTTVTAPILNTTSNVTVASSALDSSGKEILSAQGLDTTGKVTVAAPALDVTSEVAAASALDAPGTVTVASPALDAINKITVPAPALDTASKVGTSVSALDTIGEVTADVGSLVSSPANTTAGAEVSSHDAIALNANANSALGVNSILHPDSTFDTALASGTIGLQADKIVPAHAGLAATADAVASVVPEADTYAMLLAGLGLMGLMVRRRKPATL